LDQETKVDLWIKCSRWVYFLREAVQFRQKSKAGFLVIEMGESGENISFPMSAEEIQRTALREAQEAAQRTAQKNIKANKPNIPVEECELCESGEIITFVKTHSAN
jgi:hypothetical protein